LSDDRNKNNARHERNSLLATLAAFSTALRIDDVPTAVIQQARLSIVDTVACMAAGMRVEEADALSHVESQRSRLPEASVFGREERVDIQAAIRVNGYMGDVFELNDLTGGHASIAVVPTALALCEALGRGGQDLLEAVVAGIEVTTRVYSAYYQYMKSYEETGITPPGIPSTIGAAAAAARLYRLDERRTANALAIAATLAGWCPAEVIFGQGGQVKPMLFGAWPGSVAVQAVLYAQAGLDGPPWLLESGIGLYATLAHRFDRSAVEGPGLWYLATPRRKQHACCGYIHSALDAVAAMRAQGVELQRAATIEVRMPRYIIPGVSKSSPPQAPTEARFHAEYCLALSLLGADVIRPEHSISYRSYMVDAAPVMSKILIAADDTLTHYHQCVVRGLDEAGHELFARKVMHPKGSPGNAMSDEEVRGKFRTLASESMSAQRADRFLAEIDSLESAATCDWIVRSFL
jgi:2-methylcitrate dehydratase PrpD